MARDTETNASQSCSGAGSFLAFLIPLLLALDYRTVAFSRLPTATMMIPSAQHICGGNCHHCMIRDVLHDRRTSFLIPARRHRDFPMSFLANQSFVSPRLFTECCRIANDVPLTQESRCPTSQLLFRSLSVEKHLCSKRFIGLCWDSMAKKMNNSSFRVRLLQDPHRRGEVPQLCDCYKHNLNHATHTISRSASTLTIEYMYKVSGRNSVSHLSL